MILRNKVLGEIEVKDDAVLYLPDGLLGFEDLKRFILLEVEEFQPFMWLLSVEEPNLGFAVSDPRLFFPERYDLPMSDADRDTLDLQPGDTISVFVVVSVADGGRRITANLKGPVVLNTRNRLAKQVVVYSPSYSVRQQLLAAETEQVPITRLATRGRTAARG